MASSRAIRSSAGGWVENNFMIPPPLRGLTMNRCAVFGFADSIGRRSTAEWSFRSADASPRGFPLISAPPSSARNSRDRDTANWISMAAAQRTHDLWVARETQVGLFKILQGTAGSSAGGKHSAQCKQDPGGIRLRLQEGKEDIGRLPVAAHSFQGPGFAKPGFDIQRVRGKDRIELREGIGMISAPSQEERVLNARVVVIRKRVQEGTQEAFGFLQPTLALQCDRPEELCVRISGWLGRGSNGNDDDAGKDGGDAV